MVCRYGVPIWCAAHANAAYAFPHVKKTKTDNHVNTKHASKENNHASEQDDVTA